MLELNITNETNSLKTVVLGIADSFGGTPSHENAYDPKSKEHIKNGSFPAEHDLKSEMQGFETVLKKHNVEVLRPKVINGINQVYSRDIGFVIDDSFIVSNVLENRAEEIEGIDYVLDQISPDKVIRPPQNVRIEGGDVMPWNGKIFVGYSESADFAKYQVARTNKDGVEFLRDQFPNYEVHAFELVKSDTEPRDNALHLDCCFQPIGRNQAIIYEGGFKNSSDYRFLKEFYGEQNTINIDREQMYDMGSNVFSISPDIIVSDDSFSVLNSELRQRGFTVEEVPYREVSKMEGLFRCSTLPLRRD